MSNHTNLSKISPFKIGKYYCKGELLGEGAFASVYKGYHVDDKSPVAIKLIDYEKIKQKSKKDQEHLASEIQIQKQMRHPNIVRLNDIYSSEKNLYLVMELCTGGDLSKMLRKQPKRRLSEPLARKFLLHLANGLRAMVERHFIHRDLKPSNLLLTSTDPNKAVIKIADFGLARSFGAPSVGAGSSHVHQQHAMLETVCGTALYMAPEILTLKPYDSRVDLWSVGVILYQMLAGKPPFVCSSPFALLQMHKNEPVKYPPKYFANISSQCMDLLKRLLVKDPKKRISWESFFAHPFLAQAMSSPAISDHIEQQQQQQQQQTIDTRTTSSPNVKNQTSSPLPVTNPFRKATSAHSIPSKIVEQHSTNHEPDTAPLKPVSIGGDDLLDPITKAIPDTSSTIVNIKAQLLDRRISRAIAIAELGDHQIKSDRILEGLALYLRTLDLIVEIASSKELHPKSPNDQTIPSEIHQYLCNRLRTTHIEYLTKVEHWQSVAKRRQLKTNEAEFASSIYMLIYSFIVQLGRDAAVGEVLGSPSRSKDQYQRAMLLLEYLYGDSTENSDRQAIQKMLALFTKRLNALSQTITSSSSSSSSSSSFGFTSK